MKKNLVNAIDILIANGFSFQWLCVMISILHQYYSHF